MPSSRTRPATVAAATRARSGSKSRARSEPREHVAPALGVRHGELAQAAPRLAGVDQRLQRAGVVVRHALVLEDAHDDRVGAGRRGRIGGSSDAHGLDTILSRMPRTVILSAARTPIGKLGGGLSSLPATHLGGVAIREALQRADVAPEQVEHVVMGAVLQAGQGQIPSRQAQIEAGIPIEVSSETINKVCASGLRAAGMIDAAVRAGDLDVGVAGGMESMSNAPYLLPGARTGFRMGDVKALDAMIQDGLRNPFSGRQMFEEATEVGDELELTRPDLDRWALRSHERAIAATDEGRLPEEIVPVTVHGGRPTQPDTVVEVDEGPRRDSTLEALAKLPGLVKNGSHTAGNSPGVNDGAGALVLASEDWAERNGKDVLGTIVAQAAIADEFAYLARTPAKAALKALDRAGLQPGDIDLWEINEAFASVTLNSIRMLGIDEERVNVNGGAVALGHPLGASGARILGSIVLELRRRGGGYGCVAICSGGGQGDAVIVNV